MPVRQSLKCPSSPRRPTACCVGWSFVWILGAGLGCSEGPAGPPVRAGWITTGPTSDHGWNWAQELGMRAAQQAVPELWPTLLQNRDSEVDTEEAARHLIAEGNRLIFGNNLYEAAFYRLAAENPSVRFVIAWGGQRTDNVSVYHPRWHHGRYLSGMIAGAMSRSGRIGYIATDCKAGSLLGINAFTLGARRSRPDAQVLVRHTGSYYAPEQATAAAHRLADTGVDVISVHQDEPSAVRVAEERGIWAIGLHTDWSTLSPAAVLTSDTWNWGPYMTRKVVEVRDDTWVPEVYSGGDLMRLAPFHPAVPAEVRDAVALQKQSFDQGMSDVYEGPVALVDNRMWAGPTDRSDPDQLYSAPNFVQGVVSSSCAPGPPDLLGATR